MTTRRIPATQWGTLFDRFTRTYLKDDFPETVTIEVVSPEVGDQFAAKGARLLGITYDPKSSALEVALDGNDHLVFRPVEIWVVENERDGFIDTIDLVRADGTKEVLHLVRSLLPA